MNTCLDVFKNLYIEGNSENLAISPCCISPVQSVASIDFYSNDYLNKIREKWMEGKFPSECSSCEKYEKENKPSRRIGSNSWYIDHKIFDSKVELLRIDYWTGDLCNLRCAICGPKFSSAWKQELGLPINERKTIRNDSWKNLDLTKIKYIHFNGGEPLLSKEHEKLLESITNKCQVHLFYNTNATIRPTNNLLDLWSEFRLVQIDFSIDDIGDRFNYQRYPAIWEEVVSNLFYFKEKCPINCMFGVNTSLGILNYNNYNNLLDWFKNNFYMNRVSDLVEYKTQFTHGILSIENYTERKVAIKSYLDKLDLRRSTNWQKTFPELVQIL